MSCMGSIGGSFCGRHWFIGHVGMPGSLSVHKNWLGGVWTGVYPLDINLSTASPQMNRAIISEPLFAYISTIIILQRAANTDRKSLAMLHQHLIYYYTFCKCLHSEEMPMIKRKYLPRFKSY